MEGFKEGSQESGEPNPKKRKANQDELPYEGHCEEHSSPNHFKCIKCNKYICGTCVVLIHNECPKPLPVLEALNLMKGKPLKMIKVVKTKLEEEAQMFDSTLDHLNRKQEKLYQEIKNVKAEVKETKSKKDRKEKLHQDLTCHEEALEKATCNEDYEKADAKVNLFFEENCVDILPPLTMLSKEDARKLTRKDLEENTFYVMKSDNEKKKYAKVKVTDDQISFDEWEVVAEQGFSCVDFFDFINSRTAVIDTHKFIEEHKKELHNPRLPKDKIKFSQIEVKEKEVYFNSFKTSNESDFVFKFGSLVKTLGCSSVVPADAFMKVLIQIHLGEREVVITTEGGSPRAINFLLLASGIMDVSYRGTGFRSWSRRSYVYGSFDDFTQNKGISERNEAKRFNIVWKEDDFFSSKSTFGRVRRGMEVVDQVQTLGVCGGYKNEWNLFPGVVEGIQDGGIYEREESKRGDVEGRNANDPNNLSFFRVWKRDDSRPSKSTFGRVRRGMEVVDEIRRGSIIDECGLIFHFS